MYSYKLSINGVQYIVLIENHKGRLLIHINNKIVFDVVFADSESDKCYFYKILVDNQEIVVAIKYYIQPNGIKVDNNTNCYLNGKSVIDGEDIDITKNILIDKTSKGFLAYFTENGISIVKDTVKEMTLSTILGWGIIFFGIKKQLLAVLVMPFWAIFTGVLLVAVSYFQEKLLIKNWDAQYKGCVELNTK